MTIATIHYSTAAPRQLPTGHCKGHQRYHGIIYTDQSKKEFNVADQFGITTIIGYVAGR